MREYPNQPIVAVGAIIQRNNQILLVRRATAPGLGRWAIPGGVVELGEPVRDAIKREGEEETGLIIQVNDILGIVDRVVYDDDRKIRYHYVIIDFHAHTIGGALKRSPEVLDLRWVNMNNLDKYDVPGDLLSIMREKGLLV